MKMPDALAPFQERRPKLSTREAASYVNLGKSTLDRMRLRGGGPVYIKIGSRVTYDVDDLDDWLQKHKRARSSAPIA